MAGLPGQEVGQPAVSAADFQENSRLSGLFQMTDESSCRSGPNSPFRGQRMPGSNFWQVSQLRVAVNTSLCLPQIQINLFEFAMFFRIGGQNQIALAVYLLLFPEPFYGPLDRGNISCF